LCIGERSLTGTGTRRNGAWSKAGHTVHAPRACSLTSLLRTPLLLPFFLPSVYFNQHFFPRSFAFLGFSFAHSSTASRRLSVIILNPPLLSPHSISWYPVQALLPPLLTPGTRPCPHTPYNHIYPTISTLYRTTLCQKKQHSSMSRPIEKILKALLFTTLCIAILSPIPAVSQAAPTTAQPTNSRGSVAATSIIPTTPTMYFILPTPASLPSPSPSALPTSRTTDPSSNYPNNSTFSCPPPLIPNIYQLESESCRGPCCIPCPASMAFYESGKLEDVYTVTSVLRAVSGVAVGFMAICYLILPSRRRHPHSIVLTFSVLAVPWEAIGTAWLYMKKELLCRNEYEIATMSNSWFCGFQGKCCDYKQASGIHSKRMRAKYLSTPLIRHLVDVPCACPSLPRGLDDHQPSLHHCLSLQLYPKTPVKVHSVDGLVATLACVTSRAPQADRESRLWLYLLCQCKGG